MKNIYYKRQTVPGRYTIFSPKGNWVIGDIHKITANRLLKHLNGRSK